MADLQRPDRTWLCSVLFMDIAKYSSQSVEMQMKWKARFNAYLAEAIHEVPENERVILDTGDGAAVCFLGAPEAAMFAALHLWQCFVRDEREQSPGLRVRIGINLGSVKLVKDLNGSLNAIGDGINAGQRIMSFAPENQILVSQSFFEVVSRLSDDYKGLFKLKGVETDKHIREHTVYSLLPPGSEAYYAAATASKPAAADEAPAPVPIPPPAASNRGMLVGVALVAIVIAACAGWYFTRSNPATPAPSATATPASPAATPDSPASSPAPPPSTTAEKTSPPAAKPAAIPAATPASAAPAKTEPAPAKQLEPAAAAPAAADDAGEKEEDSADTGRTTPQLRRRQGKRSK